MTYCTAPQNAVALSRRRARKRRATRDADTPSGAPHGLDEVLVAAAIEVDLLLEEANARSAAAPDDDPPFDPPDEEDIFGVEDGEDALSKPIRAAPAHELAPDADAPPPLEARPPAERRAPAINLYASWDRPEMAQTLRAAAADARLARVKTTIERGGIDAAIVRFSRQPSPDVVVIDTSLHDSEMLRGLDRLVAVLRADTKIIVLGAVNDIALFRDVVARGIDQYLVDPIAPEDIAQLLCGLYAETDRARVVAVMGARGGVGASTLAYNLAADLAERQRLGTLFADLDLSFSAAAFAAPRELSGGGVAHALSRPHTECTQHKRLSMLVAPASLAHERLASAEKLQALLEGWRREHPCVVLDVPHVWNDWTRQALMSADEIVLAATPDLASLRNAENILKFLRGKRPDQAPPVLVLSMTETPGRPEIPAKDFAEALGLEPAASLAFEPEMFGAAALERKTIYQAAPDAKAALTISQLAATIAARRPAAPRFTARAPLLAPVRLDPAARALPAATPASIEEVQLELPLDLMRPPVRRFASDEGFKPAPVQKFTRAQRAMQHQLKSRRNPRKQHRALLALAGASVTTLVLAIAACRVETTTHDTALATAPAPAAAAVRETAPAPLYATPEAAARGGDSVARYELALQHLADDKAGALALLRRAAESNLAMAQYKLAQLYAAGDGVEADAVQARQWTERAAAAGNCRAMHDLGVYFARGEGAPMDTALAFRWFRRAAEFNIADSQYNLGLFYEQGLSVNRDLREALFWFMLAAAQGDAQAQTRVEVLRPRLALADIEYVQARVRAFRPRTPDGPANGAFGARAWPAPPA